MELIIPSKLFKIVKDKELMYMNKDGTVAGKEWLFHTVS